MPVWYCRIPAKKVFSRRDASSSSCGAACGGALVYASSHAAQGSAAVCAGLGKQEGGHSPGTAQSANCFNKVNSGPWRWLSCSAMYAPGTCSVPVQSAAPLRGHPCLCEGWPTFLQPASPSPKLWWPVTRNTWMGLREGYQKHPHLAGPDPPC